MLRVVRRIILLFFRWSGIIGLWRLWHRNHIIILKIHGVMDDQEVSTWRPFRPFLPRHKLEEYLRALSKRYNFISLADAVEMLQARKPILPYSIVLTFDDGYRNNITKALPILRNYNAPANFFVPTGFMDEPRPFWFDRLDYAVQHTQKNGHELKVGAFSMRLDCSNREAFRKSYITFIRTAQKERMSDPEFLQSIDRLAGQLEAESGRSLSDIQANDEWTATMTWEQIEKSVSDDVIIGSHTVDHIRLGLVDAEKARDQLVRSKRDIELHTGRTCFCLAFPNGSYKEETIDLAKDCKYVCCVTTNEGLNRSGDDLYRLKRINLPINISYTELLARIYGFSQGLSQVKNRLIRLLSK